jgi:hypothetical protein
MKRMLLLLVSILLSYSVAKAGPIGVYNDATSSSCQFATGFTSSATVVHRCTYGATGSRFKVTLPAGSAFFGFNTGFVPTGTLTSDLSLWYGQCLNGNIVLGTIIAILAFGEVRVQAADGFANITYTNCLSAELPEAGNVAWVGIPGGSFCGDCTPLPVESSTWGSVKALYR